MTPYEAGQKMKAYTVTKSIYIEELQCLMTELQHDLSGARVLHLGTDDPENVFCLSFQTVPENSNGVAHILEHTVLCGSKKYPVNDPFFSMHRRSLTTFMNAFTGADFTCYPAASQIKKDYFNLMSVYIDAVFHPLLKPLSFLQEGWRHEFLIPDDPNTALVYKGIVFNEMKGALSSTTTRLVEKLNQSLYPDLTYGYNSGGDPNDIPDLSYDYLLDFHRKYYNPSRCLFYFYGDIPLEENLQFLHDNILKDTKKVEPLPQLPRQVKLRQPITVKDYYPISPDVNPENKTLIAFGWLTCHILEQEEILALSIIDIILLSTDASPLKKALLKSGLCKEISPYLDSDVSEVAFVITLKGCSQETAPDLEKVIRDKLLEVVTQGFNQNQVEDAIHQLEIHRSEILGDGTPFGLSLFMRSCLAMQHGGEPEDGLKIHSHFDTLRKNIKKDPKYLEKLVEKHLLNNTHFVTTVLEPSTTLEKKEIEKENFRLKNEYERLNSDEKKTIIKNAIDLAKHQEMQATADIEVLPKVALSDVPKEPRMFELLEEKCGPLHIYRHECFTNSILYADVAFPMPHIPQDDLPFVRLFSYLIPQMGCGGRDYATNLDYILANTGGVDTTISLNLQASNSHIFSPSFHVRGKALYRKAKPLFELLRDMIQSVDFSDIERLQEVIQKHFTRMESALNTSGLKYAMNLTSSAFNVAGKINEQWGGLPYYTLIKNIATQFEKYEKQLVTKLEEFKYSLLGLTGAHLIISSDDKIYQELKSQEFYGLQNIGAKPFSPWKDDYSFDDTISQGRVIAAPVAFTSKTIPTLPYTDPDAPALMLASKLFDNLVLHHRIREQGGAYGGGSASNPLMGNFTFYAYRDPNITKTLAAFDEAVQVIGEGNFNLSKLEEAKLGIIQGMDSPTAPGNRAHLAYSWMREGKTKTLRKAFREKLMHATSDEVTEAIKKHIAPKLRKGVTAVFAGKELLESEQRILNEISDPTLSHIYPI